jgi:hypothetical protein
MDTKLKYHTGKRHEMAEINNSEKKASVGIIMTKFGGK